MGRKGSEVAADYADGRNYVIPNTHTIAQRHMHGGQTSVQEGFVNTIHGYVAVYSVWYADGTRFTRLDFIHGGKMHYRNINDYYLSRYLVTLAKRFAADVVAKGGE